MWCKLFDKIASFFAEFLGSAIAFIGMCLITLCWLVLGPVFGWSDTWQLIATTSLTIITQLAVMLIQHSQNKDSRVIHAKLNRVLDLLQEDKDELIGIEDKTDEEVKKAAMKSKA